jgi:hypothetical protein
MICTWALLLVASVKGPVGSSVMTPGTSTVVLDPPGGTFTSGVLVMVITVPGGITPVKVHV